jgi:uridine kinase
VGAFLIFLGKINQYTKVKNFKYKPILIIEGSYALGKPLLQYYDYKILLQIDSKTQLLRLKERFNYQDFIDRWIPLSRTFIHENNIKEIVDIITVY